MAPERERKGTNRTGPQGELPLSPREMRGLRGPVKTCREETWLASALENPTQLSPRPHNGSEVEYDREGCILRSTSQDSAGSKMSTIYSYDPSGLLLRILRGQAGRPDTEVTYRYDEQRRPKQIVYSERPDDPVSFRYDERGRKVKYQPSRAEDYRRSLSYGGSPFEIADRAPNLPGGGMSITYYDDRDRPAEVQVCDAEGNIVSRTVRIYNDNGLVVEEKQVLEDPATIVSEESRTKVLESTRGSIDDLRAQLSRLMPDQEGHYSIRYAYDAQGRVVQTVRRFFNQEDRIDTAYNERGDVAIEITKSSQTGAGDAAESEYSEAVYSYKYDRNGNWIEKVVAQRHQPGGALSPSFKVVRALTYDS